MKSKLLLCAGALLIAAIIFLAAAPEKNPADAARLNNLGCAYMNQQLFEKALKYFEDAAAADPNLHVAKVNQGIALLSLARVDPAKKILEEAAKEDAGDSQKSDPHVWYALGMLEKNSSDPQAAVDDFKRVIAIDDSDPDTWYFLGTVYSQLKQFPQAIDAFDHALKVNPLHASAQFGLSRAYQQSGDTPHAREHLTRFQYVTQNHLGAAMSLAYGEQGKYSLCEESQSATAKVLSQIPVKFVDVTREAGLPVGPTSDEVPSRESANLVDTAGPGACFLDYDNDGRIDIFFANNGTRGMSLYRNVGNGRFLDVTKQSGFDQSLSATGCTVGDYDNDGFADVVTAVDGRVQLFHNEKNGVFKNVTEQSGIKNAGFGYGVTFVDYDHDGDLDLLVLQMGHRHPPVLPGMMADEFPGGMNELWRNNANGTFTNQTEETALAGKQPSLAALGTDYNNDRAVDLVVTGETEIFENPREGKFRPYPLLATNFQEPEDVTPSSSSAKPIFNGKDLKSGQPRPILSDGVGILDIDHDGWMDIALNGIHGPSLWRNKQGRGFEKVELPKTDWAWGYGVAAFDYDNDGWVDLVAVGETKEGKGEIRLFRNLGPDGWKDVTPDVGLDKIQLKDPRAIITGDYDNDGATDLLITQNHGPAVLLKNEGGNKNNWLRLALKGLNDNKSAIGAKVEVFSDGIRQKFEIYGSNGYLGQNSPYLTVGLGQAKQADVVRMLWPTGVLQDEVEVAANQQKDFLEIDRRGSSCPTLFVWDGKRYQLVSDILGAGVVGHWVAPGERNIARPTEWVKIDKNMIRDKEGAPPLSLRTLERQGGEVDVPFQNQNPHPFDSPRSLRAGSPAKSAERMGHPVLSFRLMEPMEEVVYLDAVKLVAVDHPAHEDVYPNEYFASNPPYPDFKVVTSNRAKPPVGAWDDKGNNLLPDLLAHKFVGKFDLLPFKGFTKPHSLILDLGEPYRCGPLRLLMHGEIEYFTATGMYAASQAGIEATAPYVEAEVPNDLAGEGARPTHAAKWVHVTDDMGFPAGLPKTITADLSDKLPVGTTHIRITTNLQIYWDNILIDRSEPNEHFKLTSIPLTKANLDYHGYPRQIEDQPPGNVKYVYEQVSRTGPYARQAGEYTRYGDVLPLLTSFDDKLVVFGSGEEVQLEFNRAKLPPLPKGWTRDYFFQANGYEKDMDFYAADGSTVAPLPFRRMGTYPYSGKSFPSDDEHLKYMLEFNTRFVSGNEPRGYSYKYGK